MKKIKVLAIAGVFTASLAAAAFAEMADVKIGGEVKVKAIGVDTENGATSRYYEQRTRVNVDAKVNETTKAYISLQDSRLWGADSAAGDIATTTNDTANTGTEDQAVDVSQAYFQLDQLAGQPLSLKVGRQALAYGDHRLVGSFEWSNNARRFDGIKAVYNMDAFSVDLWTAKTSESKASSGYDKDFNGIYATLKSVPNNAIDLYLLQDKAGEDVGDSNVLTYGARVAGKVADLDYTAEFALQGGDASAASDQEASAYAIKVGYTIPAAMGLRIGAEYDYATGDDTGTTTKQEKFNNLYPTNHYLYGFNDDTGWSDIKATALTVSAKPMTDLSVGVEYWMYEKAESGDDNGTELNLLARYALNANAKLEAGYVLRSAGDLGVTSGYARPAADDSGTFTYLQAAVTF